MFHRFDDFKQISASASSEHEKNTTLPAAFDSLCDNYVKLKRTNNQKVNAITIVLFLTYAVVVHVQL